MRNAILERMRAFPVFSRSLLLAGGILATEGIRAQHRADSLFRIGDYAGMLHENLAILNGAETGGDAAGIALAAMDVARSYYYLQEKEEAVHWFRRSIAHAERAGMDTLVAKDQRGIGAIHWEQGRPDSARHYLELAEPVLVRQDDPSELATLYAILFELHFRSYGDTVQGRAYLDRCERHSIRTGDPGRVAFFLMKKGIFEMETGRCKQAQETYREGERIYRDAGNKEGTMYALVGLASAQSLCGEALACMRTMRMHTALRDSVFHAEAADRLAHYQALFDMQRKEMENLELRRRNQLLALGGGACVLLVGLGLFAFYRVREARRKRVHEEHLRGAQRQRFLDVVQAQETERARIAADLHDGIGHLLGAIKLNTSVLHGSDAREQDILDRSRGMIDEAAREVRQVSHQLMPRSLEELGLVPALRELAERINRGGTVEVQVESDREEHPLEEPVRIALYRIAQEVLSNMLKHAGARRITIALREEGDGLNVTFTDDGRGFDAATLMHGAGLGWRNIRSRVELFNGGLEVTSREGEGTRVRVTVPVAGKKHEG